MLRKVKQKFQETVHAYAERLLALGEDFIDGLYRDGMKLEVMRDNPDTLNAAVTIASREQNLQKRFQLRLNQSKNEQAVSGNQGQMPMKVDHARNKGECHYCKKRGHHIKDCRKRLQQLQSVLMRLKLSSQDVVIRLLVSNVENLATMQMNVPNTIKSL